MPVVTLKKACELTSKSKRTIQRYMSSGRLSYKTNKLGHKEIDVAELARVFDNLSPIESPKKRPDVTVTNYDDRVDKLLSAVERLEKIVEKQSEQIASLLQLDHKPVDKIVEEPESLPTEKTKSGTVKNDYLYGMAFITKK